MPSAGDADLPALSYAIEGREKMRLVTQLRKAAGRPSPALSLLFLIPGVATSYNGLSRTGVSHTWHITLYVISGVLFALAVLVPYLYRRWAQKPTEISVTFGTSDIVLVTNGTQERLRWYVIREAFALTDGYAIERRDDTRHPILIPKRALPDEGVALWTFLEQRLTGASPSIRELGVPPPPRLVNTSEQFATRLATLKAT